MLAELWLIFNKDTKKFTTWPSLTLRIVEQNTALILFINYSVCKLNVKGFLHISLKVEGVNHIFYLQELTFIKKPIS